MEPEQEIYSFPYDATIAGVDHHYRITQNHGKYGIEQDGVIIAEVAHADEWQQLSGAPLGADLLENIGDHIESHFQ